MACTLKLTLGGHTAKVLRRNRLCGVARSVAICRPSLRRICAQWRLPCVSHCSEL